MKILTTTLFAAALAVTLTAQSHEPKVIDIGPRPESITKGFGGDFFVTVMGGEAPGDGVVKVIRGDKIELFATGLDEPKGIVFTGEFLVTSDLTKVWKIDSTGKKEVLADAHDFPHPVSFLNDVALARGGRAVLVTDMGARDKMMGPDGLWPLGSAEAKALPAIGRVYSISMEGQVRTVVEANPEMPCPNGVSKAEQGRFLIAEFFYGNIFEAQRGSLRLLASGYRGADAIDRASDGSIYLSSWTQGKVWKLDSEGKNPRVLLEGMQSAADFYLDEEGGRLWVPDMKAGTITVLNLK